MQIISNKKDKYAGIGTRTCYAIPKINLKWAYDKTVNLAESFPL